MASSDTSSLYKRGREARQIAKDSTHAGGMFYSDEPLATGYNRRIINLAYENDGANLRRRAALLTDHDLVFEGAQPVMPYLQRPYSDLILNTRVSQERGFYRVPNTPSDYRTSFIMTAAPIELRAIFGGGSSYETRVPMRGLYEAPFAELPGTPYSSKWGAVDYEGTLSAPTRAIDGFNNFKNNATLIASNPAIKKRVGKRSPMLISAFNGYLVGIARMPEGSTSAWRIMFTTTPPAQYSGPSIITIPYAEYTKAPKTLYPSEAASWGYNMLADQPYTFANGTSGTVITLTGVLPYTQGTNNIALNPRQNQVLTLEAFYNVASTTGYKVKFEWQTAGASSWNNIGTASASNGRFRINFTNPGKEIQLRVTALNGTTEEHVLYAGFDFRPAAKQIEFKNYHLFGAEGIAYWRRRVVLYKVSTATNAIFISDFNDPTYFPYPNNFEEFDEPVVKVVEYLNDLLVFTEKHIWQLTLNSDGLSWTRTMLETNINIAEADADYITVIKSFVLFKQGYYFYMVVPYASTSGALSVSPISKPIKNLLDNFHEFITETWQDTYATACPDHVPNLLTNYQTYTTTNDVHIAFTFEDSRDEASPKFNLILIYNTLLRVWSVQTFVTAQHFIPYHRTEQNYPRFVTPIAASDVPGEAERIRYLKFDESYESNTEAIPVVLDTGYRQLSTHLKKTFREAQLRIHTPEPMPLQFYVDYFVDNKRPRPSTLNYSVQHSTDPNDPSQGEIHIVSERKYDNPWTAYFDPVDIDDPRLMTSETVLATDEQPYPVEPDAWQLDLSHFELVKYWRLRYYGKMKGEAPRLIFYTRVPHDFTILENYWIFRRQNAR